MTLYILILGMVGLGALVLFYDFGWFGKRHKDNEEVHPPVSLFDVVSVYCLLFGGQLVVIHSIWHFVPDWPYTTLVSGIISGTMIVIYTLCLPASKRRFLLGDPSRVLKDLGVGISFFLVAYPLATFFGNVVSQVLTYFQYPIEEQMPVAVLENSKGDWLHFLLLASFVVFLVPLFEELLFRRFLLPWCANWVAPSLANVLTSWVFVMMHMEMHSGWRNLQWGTALFILSYFLGILSLERQSLAAPFGLHMAFNIFNVALLTFLIYT